MKVFEAFDNRDVPLRWLGIGIACGLAALLATVAYHQLVMSRDYQELGQRQSYRTVRVPAPRGRVLDRSGTPLAENRPDYRVNVYLQDLIPEIDRRYSQIKPKQGVKRDDISKWKAQACVDVIQAVAQKVGAAMGLNLAIDPERIRRHYNLERSMPFTLVSGLGFQHIARFEEQPLSIPGLELDVFRRRHYPHGPVATHVLGYVRGGNDSMDSEPAEYDYRLPDHVGKAGIEGAFDRELRGTAAERSLVINHHGYRHSVFDPGEPQPGADVRLTLELGLQSRADAALRGRRGAIVVMDARTGDLLVLASAPTYDPNLFNRTMSTQTWASLNDKHLTPLVNRATAGIYAPGSIFKIMVGLAALESGLDPTEPLDNPGYYEVDGRRIKDEVAPGRYDFRRAFLKSCNTYFIHHGLRLGNDSVGALAKLNSIVARLHLGEETGIPVEQEEAGSYPTRDSIRRRGWSPGDMANLCIGQGAIAVTPLQMAVMTAAVVNGGDVLWPRIVDRILSAGGAPGIAPPVPPGAVRDRLGVSERSLRVLREAMLADVTDPEGTGREAAVTGMTIGGKTGTAQVTQGRAVVNHITWFASFAETPQRLYSVVVMIEGGEGGGTTCAPIARQMFQAIDQWEKRAQQLATGARTGGAR